MLELWFQLTEQGYLF